MTAPITPRKTKSELLFLAHVTGDTFSVESEHGEVSLVNSATLKMLLGQTSEGRNCDTEVGGGALG